MNTAAKTYYLIRFLGFGWLLFRIIYAIKKRIGWLKRITPIGSWDDYPLARVLIPGAPLADCIDRIRTSPLATHYTALTAASADDPFTCTGVSMAEHIFSGRYRFFGVHQMELRTPPDWFHNPFTDTRFPGTGHWSEIDDFSRGDIKPVWELNRFACVFDLVRAYKQTSDSRCPELFWTLMEDWAAHNPPNSGVNWKCGQEIAFRVMAWSFGLHAFSGHPSSTEERVGLVHRMIAVSGWRIEKNIAYAVSQRNNHVISEAAGLYTIGLLYPHLRAAERWKSRGRRLLEQQLHDLIYQDGGFSQHSAMYHRLLLQICLWVLWLSRLHDERLSGPAASRVKSALAFAVALCDDRSGTLPMYGHSDGSDILPLTSCGYDDFRPVLQALCYTLFQKRYFSDGPWDELLFWLYGPKAVTAPVPVKKHGQLFAAASGVCMLHGDTSSAFLHCPSSFRHRPAHADLLHMTLRHKGVRVLIDAGTYSYNAPEPWNCPLAGTAFHNTVQVDGFDQMERAGRFLWLPWPKNPAAVHLESPGCRLESVSASQRGYQRLRDPVLHTRHMVRLPNDVWLVIDDVAGSDDHRARLQWLFDDGEYHIEDRTLVLETAGGDWRCTCLSWHEDSVLDLVRADASSPRGWKAHAYLQKEPALSLTCEQQAAHAQFVTLFDTEPGAVRQIDHTDITYARGSWSMHIHKKLHAGFTITLSGSIVDTLELAA